MLPKTTRRQALALFALAGSGTLPLACGRTGTATKRIAPSPAAQGLPKQGGQLNIRTSTDPFDWDLSYVGKSFPNGAGMSMAYNSLLGLKSGPGVGFTELVVQPELAQSWEVTPDATSYTFHLRKGVKFAAASPVNGRDLTSADVKWSFEYWSRTGQIAGKGLPKAQFDWFFEGLDTIEAPDVATVLLRFKQPFVPFLNYAGGIL